MALAKLLSLPIECRMCSKRQVVIVEKGPYEKWQAERIPIQTVMPDLSAEERELLISGVCDSCFKRLCTFAEDE